MTSPEDNFRELTKLLGCKRYEQPPPGFFASFPDKIIARIEEESTTEYSSWWSWFVSRFDAKPILVCAYGLAVSGLLLVGLRLSQAFEADLGAVGGVSESLLAATPGALPFISPVAGETEFPIAIVSSTFTHPRLVFRDGPGHLAIPGSSLRLQPVGDAAMSY